MFGTQRRKTPRTFRCPGCSVSQSAHTGLPCIEVRPCIRSTNREILLIVKRQIFRYSTLFSLCQHLSHHRRILYTKGENHCRYIRYSTAATGMGCLWCKQPSTHRIFHNNPTLPIFLTRMRDLFPSKRPHRKGAHRQALQRSNARRTPLEWEWLQYHRFSVWDVPWNMGCHD